MKIVGEATDYASLTAALRTRVHDLGTTLDAVDEVAGLPARYTAKVLGVRPARSFGLISLGPILGALGVKLAVVVDEEALAKIRHRLTPSRLSQKRRAAQRRKLMEAAAAVAEDAHAQ